MRVHLVDYPVRFSVERNGEIIFLSEDTEDILKLNVEQITVMICCVLSFVIQKYKFS